MADTAMADSPVRTWAVVGLAAQIIFVASWLLAGAWQGQAYSFLSDSISDMYAVTAPHAWFLVVCITAAGIGTVLFALFGLRPALHSAGWVATVGVILLALSILGLGEVLTAVEQEACRAADPGCTPAAQIANFGGALDMWLSTIGLLLLVAAGFFLAEAMRKSPGWAPLAWPTRVVTIFMILLILATGALEGVGLGGLFERLLALTAAGGVAALAVVLLRRTSRVQSAVNEH